MCSRRRSASVNIVRVDVVTTSTIAVVTQGQSAANRSIEFRRNRVLGTDYKVVEDYSTNVKGRIARKCASDN